MPRALRLVNSWQRPIFLVGGILCVALATLGLFLPLLPTTPFLLLAAWCFSHSSERLHGWLRGQRVFGPILRDWEEQGAIRLRVKWLASLLIVLLVSYPLAFGSMPLLLKAIAGATVAAALLFVWTRPSAGGDSRRPQ